MSEHAASPPPPTAMDDLLAEARRMYPAAEVELVRSRRRGSGALAEWAVVPGPASPQQLVPLAHPRATARTLRRFSAAASVRSTVARLGAAGVARGSRGSAFGHRVRVRGSAAGSLGEHLATVLGREVSWSVGIGPARVNRKPVLQVFDHDGRTVAFGKLGDDDARHDVAAEADALARVGDHPWRHLEVPRLLDRSEWDGRLVVLQTPLRTRARQRPADQWRPPVPAMRELADLFAEAPGPLGELAWTARQRAVLAGLAHRPQAARADACLDRLLALAGERRTDVTAWHGDWAPWNLARSGRDRWQVWDWERFETGAPAGLDAVHWHVNAATRAHGETADAIRAGLRGAGAAREDAAVYLVAIVTRYLWHRERPRGGDIGDRARLVVDVLEDLLR